MKSKYFIIKNEKFIEKNNFNHKAIIILINVICIKSLLLICFIVVLLRYDIYKYISFKPFIKIKKLFLRFGSLGTKFLDISIFA